MAASMTGGVTAADEGIIKRVQEVAEKKGVKMSQVALAWLRAKGCVPVVGLNSTSVERMDEACGLRDVKLSGEEVEFLEKLYVPKSVGGHT